MGIMKKKTTLTVFTLLASVAFTAGVVTANPVVVAADGDFTVADFKMLDGASARYSITAQTEQERYENSGIRFHAVLPTTTYNAYESAEAGGEVKVSYGMIIAPYSYYTNFAEFNAATVFGKGGDKKYYWKGEEAVSGQRQILNITYDTLEASTEVGYETYHEIKGSITKILDTNYATEFVGRAYVKYEQGEDVQYDFAEYIDGDAKNSTRSPAYIAQLAEDKGLDCAEWLKNSYLKPVETVATTYTIETYVGETLVKTEQKEGVTINEQLENVATENYTGFELVSAETSGRVYANGNLTLKHVYKEADGYQVTNGGFETGDLTGWTLDGQIGDVSSDTTYWKGDGLNADGFPFGLDGTYMFSNYAVSSGDEQMGTLTSSPFTVGGSGWITYKLGGMKNSYATWLSVVDATTNQTLVSFGNSAWNNAEDAEAKMKHGCDLHAYRANLQEYMGREVYLRIEDCAMSDYGVVFADSFDTLYFGEPDADAYVTATPITASDSRQVRNGNFSDKMYGWTKDGEIGVINACERYWPNNENFEYNNVGNFFSAYGSDGHSNDVYEGNMGSLTSTIFKISGSGWITYRIGGMKNYDQVYMEVIDAQSGVKLGHFYNQSMHHCSLISYKADLSAFVGKYAYIRFVDNATGDYGLIFCDEIVTYYANETDVPNFELAINKVDAYNVTNGDFETGTLFGWTCVKGDVPGKVTEVNYFWNNEGNTIGKDGNFSFASVYLNDQNPNMEHLQGILRSNTFYLKQNSSIYFKLSGCRQGEDYAVCVRIVNALTGEIIAKYNNPNRADAKLIPYTHEIKNATEVPCYLEIVDEATNDWGAIGLDSIRVFQA